jgi:excisionase family DNA binding protein
MNKLPTHEIVPIGQAANILDVSIDTLRRWDKSGKITSTRINGKNRYFKISDLEEIKSRSQEKLSISEAAKTLGVSPSTLRRYEKKGYIKPGREGKGDRVYSKEILNSFQKPQQEKASFSKGMPISHQVIRRSKGEKKWQTPSSFVIIVLLLTTILSTLYVRDQYEINQQKISSTASKVLGAKDSGGIFGFFAANLDYEKSLFVNLGASSDQAEQLADDLGIELATLPEGERRPEDADFLIIIGSDRAPEPELEEEPTS